MRLISFHISEEKTEARLHAPHHGALLGDGSEVLDFTRALADELGGEHMPDALAWFDREAQPHRRARSLYREAIGDGERLAGLREKGFVVERADVELLAPVARPGKIICVGLNYRDHAIESKMEIPKAPVIFSKFATCVLAHEGEIVLPAEDAQVDYEAELAVVIGRRAKNVDRAKAYDHVLGYTCFNDVSARLFQFADGQWQRGKSCDTFAPAGPHIVTADELADPHDLRIRLRLNGETMQDSNTKQLIFRIDEIIEFLSRFITLEPGDMIATGTPPGVGFARQPPIYLKEHDQVEVEIEGIGVLANGVAAAS